MNLDSSFEDKSIEDEYLKTQKIYQTIFLKFFLIVSFALSNLFIFINPYSPQISTGPFIMLSLINSFFILGLFCFVYKSKELIYAHHIIIVVDIMTVVLIGEISLKEDPHCNSTMYFLRGMVISYISLVPMICRCPWKLSAISSFALSTYLFFRIQDLDQLWILRGYSLIIFFGSVIFIALGSYYNEKNEKRRYMEFYRTEKSLWRFENLIRQVLPTALVLVGHNQILFFNDQTTRLFDAYNENMLEKVLYDIKLERKPESQNCIKKRNSIIKLNQNSSLGELLFADDNSYSKYIHDFESFEGVLGNAPRRNFDVKLGIIDWKGAEARIVTLEENFVRERMNYLQEQSKYKDSLLATVSHDLRTPLNGVIGALDLLLENAHDQVEKKNLTFASRSSNLLLFMINDILDHSQISDGKLRLKPMIFSPGEVIKDVVRLIKFQAKKKGLQFEYSDCTKNEATEFQIRNDPNRLKQIVFNLLGNALKFTEKGKILIKVEKNQDSQWGTNFETNLGAIKVTVEDSGCGVKMEDLPKLFKLFGKLENPDETKGSQTGVGLGLATSQNLLRLMNHDFSDQEIKVESVYGKGSTFSFVLHSIIEHQISLEIDSIKRHVSPLSKETNYDIEEDKQEITIPNLVIKSIKRVLIVDDDQINILVLTKYFDTFVDFTYNLAFNGLQAVEQVQAEAKKGLFYDIILMDCNMPIMDGFEATKIIKKMVRNKEIPELAIIAATANVSELHYEKALQAGMIDYLTKPFKKNILRKIMDRAFKNRHHAVAHFLPTD